MDQVLRATGLRRTFGQHLAVEHVDLELARGQVLGLLGPNGAGKTTTLRMLLGHLRPSAGVVTMFGEPVSAGCAALARVGAMVEGPAFYPWLSGRRNLEVMLACRGYSRTERRRMAGAAGELMGLGEALERRYGGYSSGMARKLGIACTLAHQPDLVVLDEPTAGLDPVASADLRELLRRVSGDAGRTAILLSSHLLGDVEALADSILLLRGGRVERSGQTEELLTGSAERYSLELETDSPEARARALELALTVEGLHVRDDLPGICVEGGRAARARLVECLAAAGLPPVAIERRRMTLEQFFLEHVSEPGAEGGA